MTSFSKTLLLLDFSLYFSGEQGGDREKSRGGREKIRGEWSETQGQRVPFRDGQRGGGALCLPLFFPSPGQGSQLGPEQQAWEVNVMGSLEKKKGS
jgi:hypothetical protein